MIYSYLLYRLFQGFVRLEGGGFISYVLVMLIQFWLQPVPYVDLTGDNFIDLTDYAVYCRLVEGSIWVAKYNWFCWNRYADGGTELVEGWTYTVWEHPPAKRDLHPDIPGFDWVGAKGDKAILQMNYIFFETLFPGFMLADANKPAYVTSSLELAVVPTILGWAIAVTHAGYVDELWSLIDNGYVEPRTKGITQLCVWFDQPMDTICTDANVVSIYGQLNSSPIRPCAIDWPSNDRMVIRLCSALPDRDTYRIVLGDKLLSAAGLPVYGSRGLCLTALKGDANGSGAVNSQDMLAINAHVGEPLNQDNARFDLNCSGAINSQDMLVVHASTGNTATVCQP